MGFWKTAALITGGIVLGPIAIAAAGGALAGAGAAVGLSGTVGALGGTVASTGVALGSAVGDVLWRLHVGGAFQRRFDKTGKTL